MRSDHSRLTALLLGGAFLLSSTSCAAEVGSAASVYTFDSQPFEQEAVEAKADPETPEEPAQTTAVVTTTTVTTTTTTPVLKGDIYDTNGNLLMYGTVGEDGSFDRVSAEGSRVAFANILNEASEGLDTALEETLTTLNPTPVEGVEKSGQSVQLTLDANKQNAVYDYMASMGIVGAAVVMRSDGSLMAEVSYPSYDPELNKADPTYADSLPWGAFGNRCFQNATPGSTFKIMSEVISDYHGIYSLYDDGEWTDGGATIVNWDHENTWNYPIPERSLYSAFVNSSNIYFAKVFDQIGTDAALSDLENFFHFTSRIDCDFGPIDNNIEIYCDDDLRRSAFGQSYVRTCPIYLAALGREAVFGDMVKPFVVQNIMDTNNFGTVIAPGSPSGEVIASIPENCRQGILDGMSGVAGNLGVYVPGGYTLYAKTGTAETGAGDFLYIVGCAKNDADNGSFDNSAGYGGYGGSYIIVMQIQNPGDFDFDFASESASLYQGLVNVVLG